MPIDYVAEIAAELKIPHSNVLHTIELLDQQATVPFIARYRKEATGSLDEVQITQIRDRRQYLLDLDRRKETILATIAASGKLTDDLRGKIENTRDATELEDLYLPYRPKRKTRATEAVARGLEPLADLIWAQAPLAGKADEIVARFVSDEKGVPDVAAAWAGARDIVAERVSEHAELRAELRAFSLSSGIVTSKLRKGKEIDGAKFKDYFDFSESAKTIPSHRMLAIRRGESEEILSFRITADQETAIAIAQRHIVIADGGPLREHLLAAIEDGYIRLLAVSIEGFVRNELRNRADAEAILVFAKNLRSLLMSPPLGGKRLLAVDPGIRTGCKAVVIDETGNLVTSTVLYILTSRAEQEKAAAAAEALCRKYRIEAVAVGNGTGSRETEAFFRAMRPDQLNDAVIVSVNESGASVYSASEIARKEFPDQDITVRGAVSIGRRLQDPLAELVKIDPKSIGVGQYQHDVDQAALKKNLDEVVVSCVNAVGVELNTASARLLSYVSGLSEAQAQSIVEFRAANGAFKSRAQIRKVPKIGPKAFEQASGFLRIRNAENPLDASAVHPERYALIEQMAKDLGTDVPALIRDTQLSSRIDIRRYLSDGIGEPTLRDIIAELAKPGRDPRETFEPLRFNPEITKIEHLTEGMALEGVVTNVTNFGAFVDVGVHQDGLVHVSELAHRYVDDPSKVVQVGDRVKVKVLGVDLSRNRISLSIKQATAAPLQDARPRPNNAPRDAKKPNPSPPPKSNVFTQFFTDNKLAGVPSKDKKNR